MDGIKSFSNLQEHWSVPAAEAFRYIQLMYTIRSILRHQTGPPKQLTLIENCCQKGLYSKRLVSDLYASLLNSSKLFYMVKWEADLGATLDQAAWNIWLASFKCSQNIWPKKIATN